jgi:hypothetical protein
MRHGAPLVCSFPACRDKGVKFLYCAYCKDACAKRQFRDRHKHGGEADDNDATPVQPTTTTTCPVVSSPSSSTGGCAANKNNTYSKIIGQGDIRALVCSIASQQQQPPATMSERATISSSDSSSMHHSRMMKRKRPSMSGPNSLEVPMNSGRHNDTARTGNSSSGSTSNSSGSGSKFGESGAVATTGITDDTSYDYPMQKKIRSMQQEGRMEAWTSLLVSRPDDKNDEAMASWLMKVMAVSDPTRPIKEVMGHLKMNNDGHPCLSVGMTPDASGTAAGNSSNKMRGDPLMGGRGNDTSNNSSSTELEDSNNDSSLSSGKRSSCMGEDNDGNRRNMRDGSSNASSEDLSSENQEASNDDEQDSPSSSSSPTENDSSDDDNPDDVIKPTGRNSNRENSEVCS